MSFICPCVLSEQQLVLKFDKLINDPILHTHTHTHTHTLLPLWKKNNDKQN